MTPETRQELQRLRQRFASMGGVARAAALTPERRKQIAAKAARARWGQKKGKE